MEQSFKCKPLNCMGGSWLSAANPALRDIHEYILDPFIGSGQAAIASIKANRHYVGGEK